MAEPGARTEVHYEVLALYGDRWLIDMVLREREAALDEARHLLARGAVDGVEVRKEAYNPVSGVATGRAVFKRLKPKRHRPRFLAVSRPPPPPAPVQASPEPERRPRGSPAPPPRADRVWLWPVGLTVVAGSVLVALYVAAVVLA